MLEEGNVGGEVHSLQFLASQMQNELSVAVLLRALMVFLMRLLPKPRLLKQHTTDLEQ